VLVRVFWHLQIPLNFRDAKFLAPIGCECQQKNAKFFAPW
jgi:hypothetical protein